jgi:hypothetical protein
MGLLRLFTSRRNKQELLLKEVLATNAAVIQKREGVSQNLSLSIALWQYVTTFKLVAEVRNVRDDFHLPPDYHAHLSDVSAYLEKTTACIKDIGDKWLYYNTMLKFKPEVPLSEIIEGFTIPMQQFVGNEYSSLYAAGPGLSAVFWLMIFRGIQKTGSPSLHAVNRAIEELDVKLRQ